MGRVTSKNVAAEFKMSNYQVRWQGRCDKADAKTLAYGANRSLTYAKYQIRNFACKVSSRDAGAKYKVEAIKQLIVCLHVLRPLAPPQIRSLLVSSIHILYILYHIHKLKMSIEQPISLYVYTYTGDGARSATPKPYFPAPGP